MKHLSQSDSAYVDIIRDSYTVRIDPTNRSISVIKTDLTGNSYLRQKKVSYNIIHYVDSEGRILGVHLAPKTFSKDLDNRLEADMIRAKGNPPNKTKPVCSNCKYFYFMGGIVFAMTCRHPQHNLKLSDSGPILVPGRWHRCGLWQSRRSGTCNSQLNEE